jgi:plasmid replication initiation protein
LALQEKQDLVVKSNRLVEASYRLSLTEQQLILYAICKAREAGIGFSSEKPIRINARAFGKEFDIDPSNVYRMVEDACDSLLTRRLIIYGDDPDTGKPSETHTHWIDHATYVPGAGFVRFAFASQVAPFITRLETEFTQYRLEKIGRMTSVHAVRIYELLIQYQGIGRREINLRDLKDMLGLTYEYPRIFDLKKYVIEPAIKQINEFTDLIVSYDQRKTGRHVTHLDFKIKARPEKKPKQAKQVRKKAVVDRDYIEKHARPGETYDEAYRRLLEEAGQQRIIE